nr:MAG TPA: hypothetical protein [Caudoviricetes sp.]
MGGPYHKIHMAESSAMVLAFHKQHSELDFQHKCV